MDTRINNLKGKTLLICLILLFGVKAWSQVSFQQHNVTTTYTRPMDVYAKDINQDGYMDFVTVANVNGGQVAWWENNGQFGFTIHVLKSFFNSARGIRAEDLDSDGDIDIIAAAVDDNDILWWKNDGNENFTELVIDNNFVGAHTVEIRDMDEDGDMDILCSGFDYTNHQGEAAWWSNDGDENFTKHLISDRYQQSPFIYGEDMDADGDMDVIACGELNNEICWYKNDGAENFTEYVVDDNIGGIHTIIARDFDKDGDMDILASACVGSRFAWYENDGNQNFNRIDIENANGAIWLDAVDIDEDGDNDLIGTGMGLPGLVWYENDGNSNLTRHTVEGALTSGFALNIVDMDGDFDKDIVAIGNASNTITWFENIMPQQLLLNLPESVVWDELNQRYLVSNKENGGIIDINLSGYQKCFKNDLTYVTGMAICDNKLYIANGGQVLGVNLNTGINIENFRLDGAQDIDDIVTDNQGMLYASDNLAERIFKMNTSDQSSEVLVDAGVNSPSGLIYEESDNCLIVISGQNNANILRIDLADNSITTLTTTDFSSLNDIVADGNGNYFVSSPSDNSVYIYAGGFDNAPVLLSSDLDIPTGMYYNGTENTIAVLNSGSNTMSFIPVVINGVEDIIGNSAGIDINIFPNPVKNEINYELNTSVYPVLFEILDTQGRVLKSVIENLSSGKIDISDLTSGIYLVKVTGNKSLQTKLIIKN
ncbi:FG-GAP-like repeat-containing protein [Bacteroidota bacterium]